MRRITVVVTGLLLVLNTQAACGSPSKQTPVTPAAVQTTTPPAASEESDSGLEREINAFAEGEGNETVLRNLKERPRDALVTSIKRIRDDAEGDDPIRVKIAFLFCRLGYSYAENRRIVIEGFEKPRKYKEFYEDDAAGMLASLIREGDKELLPTMFKASAKSDGALSEELSAVFIENVRENPSAFLRQLAPMKDDVRKEVYKLTSYSILTADEFNRVKVSLLSIPAQSKEYAVSKEMLLYLDDEMKHKSKSA
jgi:hypothetical protein